MLLKKLGCGGDDAGGGTGWADGEAEAPLGPSSEGGEGPDAALSWTILVLGQGGQLLGLLPCWEAGPCAVRLMRALGSILLPLLNTPIDLMWLTEANILDSDARFGGALGSGVKKPLLAHCVIKIEIYVSTQKYSMH